MWKEKSMRERICVDLCDDLFTDCRSALNFTSFKMGDLAKKRKILNAHREYATKELHTIENVIAVELENKITLLQDIKENLAETMKILGTLTEEILGLLEKEKDIEHEIADWNKFRRDIRRGIQRIEDYLKPTNGSAGEQNSNPPSTANQALSTQQTTCNQTV